MYYGQDEEKSEIVSLGNLDIIHERNDSMKSAASRIS
jgi:hypothetical protein